MSEGLIVQMLQSVMLDIGIFGYQGCFEPDFACITLLKFADKKIDCLGCH